MYEHEPSLEGDLPGRIRDRFFLDESVVSVYGDDESSAETNAQRRTLWRNRSASQFAPEYLLPRIVRDVRREWPSFMVEPADRLDRSRSELEDRVQQLAPWTQAFPLAHGVSTMSDPERRLVATSRFKFRRDLIVGTLTDLLGSDLSSTTVLDIGCNSGLFSLDVASRGAKHVDGFDLRRTNIDQATFLAEHYGIDNVTFSVRDATQLEHTQQWDVVLNLGVLYHVTDPVEFLRHTYETCRRFAIVDTLCAIEPFSGFLVVGDKDVESGTEGKESLELLPTYRAAIETLRHVGFSEVFEVVGLAEKPHRSYSKGTRRCFLVVK